MSAIAQMDRTGCIGKFLSFKQVSLRLLLVAPFVLQLTGTVGLVGYLSFRQGQITVMNLANRLVQEMGDRTYQKLDRYLNTAREVNRTHQELIESGLLDVKKPGQLRAYFLRELQTHNLSYINYGDHQRGEFVGVGHLQGEWWYERMTPRQPGKLYTYKSKAPGQWRQAETANLNPLNQPWYTHTIQAGRSVWSPIYYWIEPPTVFSISVNTPVYGANRKLRGVVGVDLTLTAISKFLNQQIASPSERIFVIERSGNLVGSSSREPAFHLVGRTVQQVQALNSQDEITRATAQQLFQRFGSLNVIQTAKQFSFTAPGDGQQFVRVLPYQDSLGLDWLIVVVVPAADFMSEIDANTQATFWLCLASLVIATGIANLTARWVTRPLLKLNQAAQLAREGQWEAPIAIDRQDEVGQLARSFYDMVWKLQLASAEQEKLNQELMANKERLSQILEALPIGLAVLYRDGAPGYLNQTAQQLLGMEARSGTPHEQLAATYRIYKAGTQEVYPASELPLLRALQGETVSTEDAEIHRPDGVVIALDARATPIRDAEGTIVCAVSTFQDVTERRRTESALWEQEAQFRRIAESVPGVIYRYIVHRDGRSGFAYISPRCRELFGIEPEAALQDEQVLWHTLHPEDRPQLKELLLRAQQNLWQSPVEVRITTAGGYLKWLQAHAQMVRLPNGDLVWDGIAVDVTDRKWAAQLLEEYNQILEREVQDRTQALERQIAERKQVEAALRQSEAQNRAIISAIPDLIYSVSSAGIVLGYSRTEQFRDLIVKGVLPVGQSLTQLLPPEVAQRHLQAVRQALATGLVHTYEQQVVAQGTIQYEEVRVVPTGADRVLFIIRDISDRKRIEARLQTQQRFLRNVIDVCPYPIFVKDREGRFLILNQVCATIYGRTIEEMLGKRDIDLNSNQEQALEFMASNQEIIATGQMRVFPDQAIRNASGEVRWYQTIIKPFQAPDDQIEGIIGSSIDITERKQAEAALEQRQQEFQTLVENAPDIIMRLDRQGRYLYINSTVERHLGIAATAFLGRKMDEFGADPELVQSWRDTIETVFTTGQEQEIEYEAPSATGCRYYSSRIVPEFAKDGSVQSILAIARDISDRRQAETELQQAKEAAETANRAKSAFLAGMSHELRTPLNAILGFAQILGRETNLTPDQQHHLEIINRSGEHLLELINSVLDLSKIEAGHLERVESSFNLPNLIYTVVAMLQVRATAKGIRLQATIDPEVPEFVITDPGKLRQVLINLIGNGIKFTDQGQVQVRVRAMETLLLTEPPQARLQFEVEDSGAGIAPEDLERIFQAFEQTNSGKQLSEGTGLGLTLSRRFVQLIGGHLSVRSTPGEGSTFAFDLVVQLTQASARSEQPQRLVVGLQPGPVSQHILVVDDQPENRELLVNLLQPIGFHVQTANDGQEAIDRWQQWHPQLILMDIRMPVLDGLEACQRIRQIEQTCGSLGASPGQLLSLPSALQATPAPTRIIALSASVFQEDCDRALQMGCDDFLRKPFQDQELLERIARVLGITYLYREERISGVDPVRPGTVERPALAVALRQLSPDLVAQLYQATLSCDETEILQLLEQFPPDLAQELAELACQFQFDRIICLLEGVL